MTYKDVVQLLPDVTQNTFYAAKNHAKIVGPGLPVTPTASRQKMDPIKLDNFLDFITSDHIVRDLPFGERKIRMSDGSVLEMPNVIHSMGASDVIQQYKAYCSENEILSLGDSTMYKILAQCGAKVRTSLEGIDYFVAEGGRAFRTLIDSLEELFKMQVLTQQQNKEFSTLIMQCKQYLRTDFKVHLSESSEVADHCQSFALSDPARSEFSKSCQHQHNLVCVSCEQLKDATLSLQKTIHCAVQDNDDNKDRNEKLHDLSFKTSQAINSITSLKRHIVRCKNQDNAKSMLFENMSKDEVLLVCDWSMKYLPRRFREDQSDWFGKRGLPWHITMAFQQSNNIIESLGFVHIFQGQIPQDSLTTAAIIFDVISSIQTLKKSSVAFHLWSDNAGCYKSTEMMALLHAHGKVKSYDFCESQNGKGPCVRTGATLKSAIRRYINQGNDVVSAFAMKEGIEKMMKSVKYRVSVVEFNSPKKTTFKSIPAIGSYTNFSFEEDGIRVWKAFGIGEGLLVKNKQIPTLRCQPLTILKGPDEIQFHKISKVTVPKDEADIQKPYICSKEGCTESFKLEEELMNHQFVGKCETEFEMKSSSHSDITKRKYFLKLSETGILNSSINLLAETKELEADQANQMKAGWALKEDRKCKRFNKNQKDFLIEKFNFGLKTGRKEDPFVVSESMLNEKNQDGTRKFSYDEILSVQQITSFFSRMCKQNKCPDDDLEAKRETEISKLRQELDHN